MADTIFPVSIDLQRYKQHYNQIVEVYCVPLKSHVKFTKDGWDHLVFKDPSRGRTRNPKDLKFRLKYLHLAPKLLSMTTTVQDRRVYKEFTEVQVNKRLEKRLVRVEDFAFWGILPDDSQQIRIKVLVLKNTKTGVFRFHSMTPYWQRVEQRGARTRIYWDRASG